MVENYLSVRLSLIAIPSLFSPAMLARGRQRPRRQHATGCHANQDEIPCFSN